MNLPNKFGGYEKRINGQPVASSEKLILTIRRRSHRTVKNLIPWNFVNAPSFLPKEWYENKQGQAIA